MSTATLEGLRTAGLEQKLLCACNVAYNPLVSGTYSEDTDIFKSIGFLSPPRVHFAGPYAINSVLIGEIVEGVVVCYRGTISFADETRTPTERLIDWANDFDARQIEWVGSTDCHEGFSKAVDSLDILEDLPTDKPVLFTGHSKGGACAVLAALKFWLWHGGKSLVTTFGAPRCGGQSLFETFERAQESAIDLVRWENGPDAVPHTPFEGRIASVLALMIGAGFASSELDYISLGRLRYIAPDGNVLVDDDAPGFERRALEVVEEFAKHGFMNGTVAAHSIKPDGAYWKAVNQ